MQVLPPRQRAALIARDVLGWPAGETAPRHAWPSANSALQRARATMQEHLPSQRSDWSAGEPSDEERALLAAFIDAHERGDAALAVSIAAQDIRITMPPHPTCSEGIDVIATAACAGARRRSGRRLAARGDQANRMPTAASYLRGPGDTEFRAFKFDVLRIEDGRDRGDHDLRPGAVPAFGLPPTL